VVFISYTFEQHVIFVKKSIQCFWYLNLWPFHFCCERQHIIWNMQLVPCTVRGTSHCEANTKKILLIRALCGLLLNKNIFKLIVKYTEEVELSKA